MATFSLQAVGQDVRVPYDIPELTAADAAMSLVELVALPVSAGKVLTVGRRLYPQDSYVSRNQCIFTSYKGKVYMYHGGANNSSAVYQYKDEAIVLINKASPLAQSAEDPYRINIPKYELDAECDFSAQVLPGQVVVLLGETDKYKWEVVAKAPQPPAQTAATAPITGLPLAQTQRGAPTAKRRKISDDPAPPTVERMSNQQLDGLIAPHRALLLELREILSETPDETLLAAILKAEGNADLAIALILNGDDLRPAPAAAAVVPPANPPVPPAPPAPQGAAKQSRAHKAPKTSRAPKVPTPAAAQPPDPTADTMDSDMKLALKLQLKYEQEALAKASKKSQKRAATPNAPFNAGPESSPANVAPVATPAGAGIGAAINMTIPVPPYWRANVDGVFELTPTSEEYNDVTKKFQTTLGGWLKHIQVVKIERNQRHELWKFYALKKDSISKKNNNNPNELVLFHGSEMTNYESILQEGLDFRLSNTNGAIGWGIYFATAAVTSLDYVKHNNISSTHYLKGVLPAPPPGPLVSATSGYSALVGQLQALYRAVAPLPVPQLPPGQKLTFKMLLCRAAVGESTKGQQGLRVPPVKQNSSQRYDSVTGAIGGKKTYCLFDNNQCYPEHVISYQFK